MAFENLNKSGIQYLLGKLKDVFVQIKDAVRTVNGASPDASGNVEIDQVQLAENLVSDSANINSGTFIVRSAGGNASINTGGAWLMKLYGNMVRDGYIAEQLTMTVRPISTEAPITATINRDTFVAYVATSGTTTLTYTTAWSADPANYGITVTGTPAAGDQIEVVYVKENRGTITVANPEAFIETGWNLYNHTNGYARVVKYSDTYGFRISGAYTALAYSSTVGGVQSAITVDGGNFSVPGDGYVWVTGGNSTTTAIWMTWSDWTEQANGGVFEAYEETDVDLTSLMSTYFPYGLMSSGTVRDEIDLNVGQVIQRVDRMAYSAENLATAVATGREYIYDEDYIYLAKGTPVTTSVTLSGELSVNDHGMEIINGTSLELECQVLYGNNLKNKLERDVLTISQQTLTSAEKAQVAQNIGLTSAVMAYGTLQVSSIDNAHTAGVYWVNSAVTPNGWPTEEGSGTKYAILTVFNSGTTASGAKTQELVIYSGQSLNHKYVRMYTNNQWYSWRAITTGKQMSLELGTLIPANSNLNNYSTPGTYRVVDVATAATITNGPTTTYAYAMHVMQTTQAGFTMQIVIPAFGNYMWMRTTYGSGWYNWYRFAATPATVSESGLMSADDKITVNAAKPVARGGGQHTTSLDNCKSSGQYWVSTSNTSDGWPSELSSSGYGVLIVSEAGFTNIVTQMLMRYTSNSSAPPAIYMRMFINSAWTPWGKVTVS